MIIIIRIIILAITSFIMVFSIALQINYESDISTLKNQCSYFSHLKRRYYTPVIVYKYIYFTNTRERNTDRALMHYPFLACKHLMPPDYEIEYMMHIYYSSHEKDSLLKAYNLDIDQLFLPIKKLRRKK